MVLTRQQSRQGVLERETQRTENENVQQNSVSQQNEVRSDDVHRCTQNSYQNFTDPIYSTNPMQTSYSWTDGTNNSQFPYRHDTATWQPNTNAHITMTDMQNKMSSLENSLKSVTNELKEALQNINSQNQNTNNMHTNTVQPQTATCSTAYRQPLHNDISDSDNEINSSSRDSRSQRFSRPRRRDSPKLPPFTGKETWKVWFNRFEDIASRFRWSDDEKLDEILPRLQGAAGDFVYGQLSQSTRSNYLTLCTELKSRFRVVETRKTFWM